MTGARVAREVGLCLTVAVIVGFPTFVTVYTGVGYAAALVVAPDTAGGLAFLSAGAATTLAVAVVTRGLRRHLR